MSAINEIAIERQRQLTLDLGGDTDLFDQHNSQNDWVAYVAAYIGRASEKVGKNERENENFRDNMIKAGALCVAAIEAYDKKWY